MHRFDTGTPHEPAFFVTRDHASVFVQTMGRDAGVRVHRADPAEIRRLWRAHACPELARVGSERPQATCGAPAAVGDRKHRQPGADREGDRDRNALPAAERCRMGGDRRQHKASAGNEDEPEREAEHEAAAQIAARPAREAHQRPLEDFTEPRDDQRRRDDEEETDREISQQVLRQAQLSEQPRDREQRAREADDDAGDDRVGPPGAAACGPGEHDRQDRERARRDCGD